MPASISPQIAELLSNPVPERVIILTLPWVNQTEINSVAEPSESISFGILSRRSSVLSIIPGPSVCLKLLTLSIECFENLLHSFIGRRRCSPNRYFTHGECHSSLVALPVTTRVRRDGFV